MLPVSALNTIVRNQVVPKKMWRNLALMNLKLKNCIIENLLLRVQQKILH